MSLLSINHHRINHQRINFPFPPITAFTARLIDGLFSFQHQPLTAEFPGLWTYGREFIPMIKWNQRRNPQQWKMNPCNQFFQNLPSLPLRMFPKILSSEFQEIIRYKTHWRFHKLFSCEIFSSDPCLEHRKR